MADKDLQTLLQLANINSSLAGPQVQQQEIADRRRQGMMQTALQLLGLQQQQQNGDAERQLQAQHYQDVLAEQQSAHADQSGQFWGGELPAKYAGQQITAEDVALQREMQGSHNTELERIGHENATNSGNANFIEAMKVLGLPGMSPVAGDAIAHRPGFEQFGVAQDAAKAQAHMNLVKSLIPELAALKDPNTRALYGHSKTTTDPSAYDEAMQGVPALPPTPAKKGLFDGIFGNPSTPTTPTGLPPSPVPPTTPQPSYISHPSGPNSFVFDLPGYTKDQGGILNVLRRALDPTYHPQQQSK